MELERAKRLSDIGVLAATVAHELRNPLAAIRIASYNIKQKAGSSLFDNNLATIDKKVSESNQIISNLLFYSRIKPPKYDKVNIYDLIEESIAAAAGRYQKAEAVINKMYFSVKDVFFDADNVQLLEVFGNILNNAYDALPDFRGKIEVEARVKDSHVDISVKDNGAGIEEEDIKKIFDPFFTTKAKGTGLGLAVCKQIINMHGGEITIASQRDKGALVSISLPVNRKT